MSQNARVALWVPTADPPDAVNDGILTNDAPNSLKVIPTRFDVGGGGSGGGIEEAPINGQPYSRQDAGWVLASSGGGVEEAPEDGSLYARSDADWSNITPMLALKAPLNSPTFLGDPKAPTPAPGDNDTSIATTAFTKNAVDTAVAGLPAPPAPATVPPLIDGTAAVGASAKYAREDHVHPVDSTRAPLASPVFTGDPKAPTPTAGDNDTSIATTAFTKNAIDTAVAGIPSPPSPSSTTPAGLGPGAVGASALYARADHEHPSFFRKYSTIPAGTFDFNTLFDDGYYNTGTFTNGPPGISGWVFVAIQTHSNIGSGYSVQRLTTMQTFPMQYWMRYCDNNTWQPWVRLLDASQIATAAEFLANTASKILTTDKVWAAAAPITLTDAASVAPNFSLGINFYWPLGAAGRTLANPTNQKNGQTGTIRFNTTSGSITTWGSDWKFAGGIKPTTTAAATYDVLTYSVIGANFICCSFLADVK